MGSRERVAVIDREACKPQVCGFYLCHKVCPVDRSGIECVTVSPIDQKALINEDTCISCGICVKKCPTDAITIINLPSELQGDPIHRYGANMFALYRLPIPKKGMVVGMVGPNGIGKSTILRILSGNMKPNCGNFLKGAEWETILKQFSGTELHSYLSNMENVKIAYKPQNIDLVQKTLKGTVIENLEKIDREKRKNFVIEKLKIGNLMEKEISTLSGGEMQLFAIAATIIKGGNFYFFDEPSSYLDVEQRLRAAKIIAELAENNFVMVVEHDLAVADYLADQVHLIYGSPGVFGIVSKPYGVRVGINTYLDGYIREENMRFRQESITFSREGKAANVGKVLFDFGGFEKTFKSKKSSFTLKTLPGQVYQEEVIGILGPNGIGKTTFVRMLTGEEQADSGKGLDLKLAYKPQRLGLTEEQKQMTAKEFIRRPSNVQTVINLLGVNRLFERTMGSLSGGELQATFIAATLAKDHDIFLFDEPSAFLDVEQRLVLSKVLADWTKNRSVSGFVVDHDLQVIDSLSNRVMIFEGEPGIKGIGNPPVDLKTGMNKFLKSMDVTFRRDPQSGRARANKIGSVKDREQKEAGQYYYG